MLAITKSLALQGLNGYLVSIQVDISNGIPDFQIVGLPDVSVKESKERVKTAIRNSNIEFLSRKIIVNLSPANTRKEGSMFDLPIAIGILIANKTIKNPHLGKILMETIFIGELSLNGNIEKINGILPICIEAKKLGIKRIIVPKLNAKEANILKDIDILPVNHLKEVIDYLNGKKEIVQEPYIKLDNHANKEYEFDFSEVKGQENVKRALEVAASGGHNCILIGSPGSGKTMLARRLPSILPNMSLEESLEVSKIYSILGLTSIKTPLITKRPFRNPHHTITPVSLIGGGKNPKPGEISLSHLGVLFLDELLEFNRNSLECLRLPLEDRKVTISRVHSTVTYPCEFMLIASMNPCECGYYGSQEKSCSCKPKQVKKYINRISGPLLDRIDIHIEVTPIRYHQLELNKKIETSNQIKSRVNQARNIQLERYQKYHIFSNSELTPPLIEKFCELNTKSKKILEIAFDKLGLSARAYNRILKVARTIADLDNCPKIQEKHLAEAIQYRSLDRKYWNHP